MADLVDTDKTRVFPTSEVFSGTFTHDCMAKCGNRMTVPDRNTPGAPERLEDGQIWICRTCGAMHEYYLALSRSSRGAIVRLLKGLHVREGFEPPAGEFIPK